jgi:hypothetical protein
MREVTIECLGDTATIPDLGIHMHRGETQPVSLSDAQRSLDLSAARRLGLVSIKVLKAMAIRTQDEAPLLPGATPQIQEKEPLVVPSRPSPQVQPVPQIQALPPPPPLNDFSLVVVVLQQILSEIKGLRQDLGDRPTSPVNLQALEDLLHRAQTRSGGASGSGQGMAHEILGGVSEDLMFIPTPVFDGTGRVTVQSTEGGSSGSLDDAVAILKAKKKGT